MATARQMLRRHFGYPDFRPAQAGVVRSVLAGRDTLAVLPTGGGKSICFQVPALVLGGLTVVVSPLISLMQDQVAAAAARGIRAACLNSSLSNAERTAVWQSLRGGQLRLLYVSPERLDRLAPELREAGIRPTLLAIDEAHCIAEWGHDFRPSYRTLGRARYRLGRPPTVALTGSATPEVRDEIARALSFRSRRYVVHLGSFDRPNLWFGAVRVAGERERREALLNLLRGDDHMVIVYAPTRNTTEALARVLTEAGHRAAPYHAGLSKARRAETLDLFLGMRLDVMVATCAFGMGIDQPKVRMVVHWSLPPTPEAYYQEAGRAGRDGEFARCVLLWHPGDARLHRSQLDVTFPPRRLLERIWLHPSGVNGIPANVLDCAERLRRELHPERGPVDWRPVRERRKRAEARIGAVEAYARSSSCRRRELVGYFGEKLASCAGCDRCRGANGSSGIGDAVDVRDPLLWRLERWRAGVALQMGVAPSVVLGDATLGAILRSRPVDRTALARVAGIGPRVLAKFSDDLLRLLRESA
ncbi:MAG: RecQ family ATP-dependent DNA helicase [Gemmatimonadales bacterium]